MKFTQPRLPYAPDDLAPVISQTTIDYHYGKHEKAYIDTLNQLIENTPFEDMAVGPYLLFLPVLPQRTQGAGRQAAR